LIGQQGVAIRQLVTHALLHRSQPETVKAFAIGGEYAKQIISMQPGQALFFGTGEPVVTTMPEMTRGDMEYAAQGKPARPPQLVTIPPAPIPPTERVTPPPSVPTQPMTPPTVQEQILDLLRSRPTSKLTSTQIADVLEVDKKVIQTEIKALYDVHRVTRHETGQRGDVFAYSVPLNQSTLNAGA
jgi:hypothetical protein